MSDGRGWRQNHHTDTTQTELKNKRPDLQRGWDPASPSGGGVGRSETWEERRGRLGYSVSCFGFYS
jgi:hypothetical protein